MGVTEMMGGPAIGRRSRLEGRFVVLTGGSSGIGRALAGELAARGASVLVGSRRKVDGGLEHRPLDLASYESVREFAAGLVASGTPIDLLVLNAGVHVPWKMVTTADGHELHRQVNYLSNFLLTHLLLDLCHSSGLKQVVYIGSEAHRMAEMRGPLAGFSRRYAQSKAAAMTFFLRFQELHPELRVQVISPGYVDTEVHRHKGRFTAGLERTWSRARPVNEVAREILRTIELPESTSVYWDRGRAATPSRRCRDGAVAEALWRDSVASLREVFPNPPSGAMITNYARTWRAFGPGIDQPADVTELAALVRQAAGAGRNVRLVGARHSYNDCFFSHSSMISLGKLNRNLGLSGDRRTITCEAGVTIGEICTYLDQQGYALRFCGNHGQQTLAGALATGTHGYGRDGGLMSELVTGLTLMGPDGQLVHYTQEDDLRALRLGLGTLGVVVEVTLAVEPCYPCVCRTTHMPRQEFVARLDELARSHQHLRYMAHPFDESATLYFTIDRTTHEGSLGQPVTYDCGTAGGAGRLLVPWLRMPAIRSLLGQVFLHGQHEFTDAVPFSTSLFVNSGVRKGSWLQEALKRIGRLALDRNDWQNMELAVPLDRYPEFVRLFEENLPRMSGFATNHLYYTSRVCGSASSVLLGPNVDRDVVFVDIHADPRASTTDGFLRRVEAESIQALSARPHWGKLFFSESDTIRSVYPKRNIENFLAAKRRFDPEGVFSSDYTRRVLGV
ncbi:MAG: SDR family NAD(P)-dependent oxidoreductase [Gemmatimonadota bacterium]